jgi:hypothetical protein
MQSLAINEINAVCGGLKAEEFFSGVGLVGAGLLAAAFAPEALAGAALYMACGGEFLTGVAAGGLIADSLN